MAPFAPIFLGREKFYPSPGNSPATIINRLLSCVLTTSRQSPQSTDRSFLQLKVTLRQSYQLTDKADVPFHQKRSTNKALSTTKKDSRQPEFTQMKPLTNSKNHRKFLFSSKKYHLFHSLSPKVPPTTTSKAPYLLLK